jgi:hypothetical protein
MMLLFVSSLALRTSSLLGGRAVANATAQITHHWKLRHALSPPRPHGPIRI